MPESSEEVSLLLGILDKIQQDLVSQSKALCEYSYFGGTSNASQEKWLHPCSKLGKITFVEDVTRDEKRQAVDADLRCCGVSA
eukprot:312886-Amphidinium_carterae.2